MKKLFIAVISIIFSLMQIFTIHVVQAAEVAPNNLAKYRLEVENYIEKGDLPNWHANYLDDIYYYTVYNTLKSSNFMMFANLSKGFLELSIKANKEKSDPFIKLAKQWSLPINEIAANKIVGIYYDGIDLYVIWSCQLLASDDVDLMEITINNQKFNPGWVEDEHLGYTKMFTTYMYIYVPENNVQLNLTQIGGWREYNGQKSFYGIWLEDNYLEINSWEGSNMSIIPSMDTVFFSSDNGSIRFDLSYQDFIYNGQPQIQFITNQYLYITDLNAQSIYDKKTKRYHHYIYFNTKIDIDKIYRIDLVYYYKNQEVIKSLMPFDFSDFNADVNEYPGFKKEKIKYKNNEYQYQLQLDLEDEYWNLYSESVDETKFSQITEIKLLRVNYLSSTFNRNSQMDIIAGVLIKGIDSKSKSIWEYDSKNNIFAMLGSSIIGLGLIYLVYLLIKKVAKFIKVIK